MRKHEKPGTKVDIEWERLLVAKPMNFLAKLSSVSQHVAADSKQ